MRVIIVTPTTANTEVIGRRVAAQEAFFRRREDEVVVQVSQAVDGAGAASLPVGDLYIFHCTTPYPLLEELARLERGAAMLYCYQTAAGGEEGAGLGESPLTRLAAYADLVVAEGQAAADTLVEQGYTALPVHVLPVDGQTTPAEYEILWAEAVAAATAWLPNPPYPYGRLAALEKTRSPLEDVRAAPAETASGTDLDLTLLLADIEALSASAATMQRDYVVRSRLPLVGPILAWLRRNLTSHLREPYIDPTFQRQELFNRQVAKTLDGLVRQQAVRLAALEERVARLERRPPEDSGENRTPLSPPEA